MGLISRRAAITQLSHNKNKGDDEWKLAVDCDIQTIWKLPSAHPETSRIERELHGKTPEEQYEFLYWLLLNFGLTYTDSRLAVIEWLRGEQNERGHDQQTSGD